MPREKETYRDNLELLMRIFPGVGAISIEQAAQYYGVSRKTLERDKTLPRDAHNRIPLPSFARWLSV